MNDRSSSDIILYSSPEGTIRVEVLYAGETFLAEPEADGGTVWC